MAKLPLKGMSVNLQFDRPPLQRHIGNCWLIALLQTLWSNWPQVLRGLVSPLPNGQIDVKLTRGTFWINPVFGPNTAQPLWAAAIEKAVSILLGGYANMFGNSIKFACELILPKFELIYVPNSVSIIPTPRGYHALHPPPSLYIEDSRAGLIA